MDTDTLLLKQPRAVSPVVEMAKYEVMFWFHAAIILGGVLMGLVLPWQLAVGAVILHRMHLRIFGGCIVSSWQKKRGTLHEEDDYMQQASRRLFGIEVSKRQVRTLDRSLVLLSIVVTVLHQAGLGSYVWLLSLLILGVFAIFSCIRLIRSKSQKAPCAEDSCELVGSSDYSKLWFIPVEYAGLGYFMLLILMIALVQTQWLAGLTLQIMLMTGLTTSVAFVLLQFRTLKAVCGMCMNVHATMLALFTIGLFYLS